MFSYGNISHIEFRVLSNPIQSPLHPILFPRKPHPRVLCGHGFGADTIQHSRLCQHIVEVPCPVRRSCHMLATPPTLSHSCSGQQVYLSVERCRLPDENVVNVAALTPGCLFFLLNPIRLSSQFSALPRLPQGILGTIVPSEF